MGDNQELQYKHRRRMSSLNQNTAECELVGRSLLEINMLCTQIMAILNSNGDVHIGEKIRNITLTEHSNNFQLLPPEVVKLFMDIDKEENIQYVKQHSDERFKIRKLARITGSTLHSGLGLETLTKQKEHHYIHVRGRIPPPIPENIQKLLDHSTKNEVNAIATLISTVVPAYLPACYPFYELGPAFVHSEERQNILEVSADGLLQCSNRTDSCPNYELHRDTLHSGLGLETLTKQKEHHYIHVRGRIPPPIPENIQKLLDHSTKNEVNAIATLISTVVPAYLPACYAFYELGPAFVHSEERQNILEVSADGLLQCSNRTDSCPNYEVHRDRKILVEIKSPVPKENVTETVYYDVPNRYMAQVQAEMKAYCCEELWFLCSTPQSASVSVVYFDSDLWEKIWGLVKCLYKPEKPTVPTKLHSTVKDIKLSISRSKQENTKFLCEVPTVTGQYGNVTLAPNFASPYCPCPVRELINYTPKHVMDMNAKLSSLASTAFKQCHEVLRKPGKELLVFMLTDKD